MAKAMTVEQKERASQRGREYYQANRERILAYQSAQRTDPATRTRRLKYAKEYYATDRGKKLVSERGKSYYRSSFGRAKALVGGARSRRPEGFSITVEWAQEKIERGICERTGLPLLLSATSGPWVPSLDRVDSSMGYTVENTQMVCWMYNAAKNQYTDADVLRFAEALCIAKKR